MSLDPYSDHPDLPPRSGGPAGRELVQLPAVFLIVIAALNILGSLYLFIEGVGISVVPASELERRLHEQNPDAEKQMQQLGWTIEGVRQGMIIGAFSWGAVGLIASILTLVGGILMLRLKAYGMAVFAAILSLIPCVSCSACCGLGEGIGIWALVVLFSEPVKAAFERAARWES